MIDKVISFFETELNQFLTNRFPGAIEPVEPNAILDQSGSNGLTAGKIGITLVNIEEERMMKAQLPYEASVTTGALKRRNPEIKLNLFLLFAANFDAGTSGSANYKESLKRLSGVIGFFQSRNIFTQENSPGLDDGISRLTAELYTLPMEQQNYLWAALGAKYMPSVIYKIRLITVQEGVPLGSDQPITTLNANLGHK
ncbi:MAG: DUF4255 domain-containing protein [Salibacteraceae bacterium]